MGVVPIKFAKLLFVSEYVDGFCKTNTIVSSIKCIVVKLDHPIEPERICR